MGRGPPAEAADGADVGLTMVLDADAVVDVVRQAAPAAGTPWVQTSTVGIEGAQRTADVARDLDLVLVDVSGKGVEAGRSRCCCQGRSAP